MRKRDIDFTKKRNLTFGAPGTLPGAPPKYYIRDSLHAKDMYTTDDIMEILSVSRSTAYKIILHLKERLPDPKQVLEPGLIPKEFFDNQLYYYSEKGVKKDEGN